jgi:hypothetical protein
MKKITLLLLTVFYYNPLMAITKIPRYKQLFYDGHYIASLRNIDRSLTKKEGNLAELYYWKGMSHKRLQNYRQAAYHFSRAIKFKSPPKDLYYEFGQSLIALDKLDKAKLMFALSAKKGVMKAESLYFLSGIFKQQKKLKKSLQTLEQIVKVKESKSELTQIASLEAANIKMELTPEHKKYSIIKREIMPMLTIAYRKDTSTESAKKITHYQAYLDQQYIRNIRLKNKRFISRKEYDLSFSQDIGFDTNVVQEANEADQKATDKESLYYSTHFNSHWRMPLKSKKHHEYIDFDINYEKYHDSDTPIIHENDNYTLTPTISSLWEHSLFNQQATFEGSIGYSYHARDRNQEKDLKLYSKTTTFTIGEKYYFSSKGNFSIKFSYEIVDNHTDTLDSTNYSLYFTQSIRLPPDEIYLLTFKTKHNNTNDSLYEYRDHTFNITHIYLMDHSWQLQSAFSFSLVEYINQKDLRGIEKKFAPSIGLQKTIAKKYKLGLKYAYTRNASKSKSIYDYEKHQIIFNMGLNL